MSGLFGAINLGHLSGPRVEDLVSAMLGRIHGEDFYSSRIWSCPSGRACFASAGVEGLPGVVDHEEPRLEGLSYGRVVFPRTTTGDWLRDLGGFHSLAVRDDGFGGYRVAADRRGSQPVYYAEAGGFLCFAPEVGALFHLPGMPRGADYGALGSLISSGHLLEDTTLFTAIRRLEGGNVLEVKDGRVEKRRYWRFSPGARGRNAEESLLGDLGRLIGQSVESCLSHDPAGTLIFLSGGCDSRVILGCARSAGRLQTVSWGVDNHRHGTDAEVAERLAAACGSKHFFLRRRLDDFGEMFEEASLVTEGQSDVAVFHPQEFRLMRDIRRRGFRRVVRGDETFGWKRMNFSRLGAFAHVGLRRFGDIEGLAGFFRPEAARKLAERNVVLADRVLSADEACSENQRKDILYFNQRLQNYLNSCASFKQRLFEHLNPLLADEVLDFLSLVPDHLREDKRLFRTLLARQFPDLHAIGYAESDGLEDWSDLWRKETPVRSYLALQLADARSAVWQIYDRLRLQTLFDSRAEAVGYGTLGLVQRGLARTARDLAKPVSRRAAGHLQARLAMRAPLGATKILLRFLVVKNWVDRYSPVLS
jgi:asparagine synthetase B (glutamine-hydrolysing)